MLALLSVFLPLYVFPLFMLTIYFPTRCSFSNLIGPPVSHMTSLQLDVELGCPRPSQVRLEGYHLGNVSHMRVRSHSIGVSVAAVTNDIVHVYLQSS